MGVGSEQEFRLNRASGCLVPNTITYIQKQQNVVGQAAHIDMLVPHVGNVADRHAHEVAID